jgi:hypothetical protein
MRRRSLRFVLPSLVLLVGSGVWAAPPAVAARACESPSMSYFEGAYSAYVTSVFGARGRIEYNNPDLCGSDVSDSGISLAWSMVTAHSDADPNGLDPSLDGWAQAGYGQFGGSNLAGAPAGFHIFSQWTRACKNNGTCRGDAAVVTTYNPAPTGSTIYSNYLRASDQHIVMYAASTFLDSTSYNPAGDWDAAWAGQFFGETKHLGDDVVGVQGDPTSFDYLQKYASNGDINFFVSLSHGHSPGTRYHYSTFSPAVGGLGFRIWTDPL